MPRRISISASACLFFNDTATTEIYPLSLHDALPILLHDAAAYAASNGVPPNEDFAEAELIDRKSTRLNSSHLRISNAVFSLKKKKNTSELQSPQNIGCRLLLNNDAESVE